MHKGKQAWDMVVLVLAVVTSFSVGFELVISTLSNDVGYKVFTYSSDVLFLFDILV